MLRANLRRILALLAVVVGGTAAASAALGALAGKNVVHSLAVGYYVVGAAVLVGSFMLGSRGAWRSEPVEDAGALHPSWKRRRRRATPDERSESKRGSVGLFVLGIGLIVLGAALDPSRRAF